MCTFMSDIHVRPVHVHTCYVPLCISYIHSTSVGRTPAGPGNFRLTRVDVGVCCGVEKLEGGGGIVEDVRVEFLWSDGVCDRGVE